MDLTNKTAIITGARRGIGKAISYSLASEGVNLALCSLHNDGLEEIAKELMDKFPGVTVYTQGVDVKEEAQVKDFISNVVNKFSKIDFLVNNAGVTRTGLIENITKEDFDLVMDTNIKGVFLMIKNILPLMKEENSGHIVNISSQAGIEGFPYSSVYCASKFGLLGMAESLKHDLTNTNINITNILPGAVDTDIWNYIEGNFNRSEMINPVEIANCVTFALKNSDTCYIENILIKPKSNNYAISE